MKRKHSAISENNAQNVNFNIEAEVQPPSTSSNSAVLYVILENAQLEAAKVGNKYELLSFDEHGSFLRKANKDPANYRPDITHQCLLMLLDSPLNRAGRLKVFVHTARNVLIEISPLCRIPRTYSRFAGLMVQLLHKLNIRAVDGPQKLLRVIKNPVQAHLPIGCLKFGSSFHSNEKVGARQWAAELPASATVAVVVGAMAKGRVSVDYTEKDICISGYPLSAALTCSKVCCAFEEAWGIL